MALKSTSLVSGLARPRSKHPPNNIKSSLNKNITAASYIDMLRFSCKELAARFEAYLGLDYRLSSA